MSHTASVLETPRLKLRVLHEQDRPAFAALNSDPEVIKKEVMKKYELTRDPADDFLHPQVLYRIK